MRVGLAPWVGHSLGGALLIPPAPCFTQTRAQTAAAAQHAAEQEVRPASNCSRLRGARRSSSELCSLPLHFRCQDYPPLSRSCPPPLRAPPSFTWISRSNPPSRRLVAASMGTAAVRLAGLGAECPPANDNALARHTHARSPAASLRGSDESQTKREQSPRRVTREREKTKT